MFVQVPKPYEGELLYSVIARYITYYGMSWRSAYMALFGFRISARFDLPTGLAELSNRTALTWARSPFQIATELTQFPYFVRFLPETKANLVLRLMSGRNSLRGSHLYTRLGLSSSTIKNPPTLLFCKSCRETDLMRFGETYWRRVHQLPGVLVCHEHGCILSHSTAPALAGKNWTYFDATTYTVSEGAVPVEQLSFTETEIARSIASRSSQILSDPSPCFQPDELKAEYRSSLTECGFVDRANSFSASRAEAALRRFYGDRLLKLFGCTITQGRSGWLRTMLHPSRAAPRHPLRHILLEVFLSSCASSPASGVRCGAGVWKCPNPYGHHTSQFPIRAYKSKPRQNMAPVISAQCPCGMRFAFSDVSPTDPLVPRISSVRKLAPSWRRQLLHQRGLGTHIRSIATQNALPFSCVRKALAEPEVPITDQEHLAQLRSEWHRLLVDAPGQSRSTARERNPGLYAELKMLDPEWLHGTGTQKSKPRRLSSEDWNDRDQMWASHLAGVARKLREDHPSCKISATSILRNAGLKLWILSKAQQLPECQKVLSRLQRDGRICITSSGS